MLLWLCLGVATAGAQGGPGTALQFDGTNDFVSTSLTVTNPQAFTLSVWFNTTTTRGGRILGFGNSQTGTSTMYDRAIYMSDAGRVLFGIYSGTVVQSLSSSFSYNDGGWHQATATFSATSGMELYVDAQLVDANGAYNIAQVYTGWWRLGGDSLGGWPSQPTSSYFAGLLDEVQIWNRERSAVEIQTDFHRLLVGSESGLSVLYHFDEGSGTTSADAAAAAGANTATLVNGPVWVSSAAPVGVPAVVLLGTTNRSPVGVTVNGLVNPNFQPTSVYFQYGTTTNYGSQSGSVDIGSGGSNLAVSVTFNSLTPGTTYQYRLSADSAGGTTRSTNASFTTLSNSAPSAVTLPYSAPTYNGATLNASVNPSNAPTTVYFQFGATTNYGSNSAVTNLPAVTINLPVAIAVSGSPAGSLVNFRVVATNVAGTQFGTNQTFTTLTFSNLSLGPPRMTECASAWGDFDNDGLLDLLVAGNPAPGGDERVTQIWRNLGNGSFTNIGAALPGVNGGYYNMPSVAWGDYDNDGWLDILIAGATTFYGDGRVCQIWRNLGNGTFTNSNITLPGISAGQAAWADFDGDGRLDVIITGNNGSIFEYNPIAQIWRNTGNGFVLLNSGLPAVKNAAVAVGDFDNDGFPDVAISGDGITQVWRNQGDATFTLAASLPGRSLGSLAWVDANNDGFLDLLVSGLNPGVDFRCELYRNNGGNGTFTLQQTFTGIWGSDAQVGDFDNDGLMDVALQGAVDSWAGNPAGFIAEVWRNVGAYFTNIQTSLQGGYQGRIAWGDYNNDGRLEVTAGTTTYGHILPVTNTPPQSPTGLSAPVSGTSVLLSWAAGSDAQTPTAALSYNIRVGTTSGGAQVVSPQANMSTGFRRVPQMGNAQLSRTKNVTRLTPGTRYYWSVQTVDGAYAGSPFATEGTFFVPFPPTVTTLPATSISSTAGTLQGTANPNGAATTYYFRWGPTMSLGNFTATNSAGSGSNAVSVSSALSGLQPATTYYYQLTAANGGGTNAGAMLSFTSSVAAPYVTTLPATQITGLGGTLQGTVDPNGISTAYYFRWGTTTNLGNFTVTNSVGSGSSTASVSVALSGLTPLTTYYYQLVGTNNLGTIAGAMLSFTSSVAPPSATTLAATLISSTGAALQGTVNPKGSSTTYYFNWGATTNLGNFTATNSAGGGSNNVSVGAALSGLQPATIYYYQVIAASIGGPTAGAILSFTTSVAAPSVTTLPATSISSSGGTLQGTANPNGASTSYYFRWGATTNLGNFTATNSAGAGSSNVPASAALSGLQPATTYFYQLVAANNLGTNAGGMLSFTSSIAGPFVTTLSAISITSTGGTLQGTVNPNGASTTYYFRWGGTTNLGNFTVTNSAGSGSSTASVSVALSGLLPETTYYYQLIAANSLGTNAGAMLSFASSATPPSVTTLPATSIGSTNGTLQGTVNPNGKSTTYYFSWGATTNLGNFTVTNSAGAGSNNVSASAVLSGLLPVTTCYYQLIAANIGGPTEGAMLSFTSSVAAPYVATLGPSDIKRSSGVMHGSVASNGLATAYFFQYGVTTNYGSTTPISVFQPHTALEFNGTNQYAQAGSISLANSSFTVEMWLRHSRSNSYDIALFQGTGSPNQGLHVGFRPNNVFTFAFWGNDLDTSAAYTDTDWHHWACTYDSTNRARIIYRDASVVASSTASANYQGSGNLLLGYAPPIPAYFSGALDEVRIWSGARSATQIAANMNTPASGAEPGLKALWHLDEGAGSVAADTSSNGFTAALSNAPVWVAGAPVFDQGTLPASFAVSAVVSNLLANNIYHYRIGASNALGTTFGIDQFFRPIDTTPINTPVPFAGFDGDAVLEQGGVSLQMHPGYGWFVAGMGGHADGLPMNTTFTSLATACGNNTLFHLAPPNVINALKLGDGFATNASLALSMPAAYTSFSVLAASGNGGGLPDLTFQFVGGSNYVVAWNALDWCVSCGNRRQLGLAAVDSLGRNSTLGAAPGGTNYGSGFTYERNSDFGLYETKIDLAAAGLASNKLQSVSFNQAAAVSTAVFGMSGKLTLLPLSIVQQPATNNACVGDVALFAIGVDHPVLASYQWQRQSPGQTNFISVAFATNSSYTTQPLTTFDDNAAFRVVVSGPLNVVTSTPAFLRVFPSSPASPLFSFDFTSLPTNSAIYGSAYLDNTNGVLVLTSGDTNQTGALIIADPVPGQVVRAFSASFKAQISPGTAIPGSGFSFNWATNIPNGTWPTAENGVGNGLSIAFDIYDNGGNEAPAIDVKWYGAVIAHQLVSSNLLITGTDFARVFIRLNSDDTLDVFYDCQAIYSRLALPPLVGAGLSGARFAFGARTSGNTANQALDDFALEVTAVTAVPLAITQQPGDAGLCPGGTATFSVMVNDPPQVAGYQWQRRAPGGTNFVNVPGATNTTYITPTLTNADDFAGFRVIVIGYYSSLISAEAQVRVPTVTSPTVSYDFSSISTNTAIYGGAFYDGESLVLEYYEGVGSFIVNDPAPGGVVRGFTAAFQVAVDIVGEGGYGFSFNWATNLPNAAFGQGGAGNGLTVAFNTLFGADYGNASMVVSWNGNYVASAYLSYWDIARGYYNFNDVVIRLNADQTLDVLYRCQPIFTRLPVPATPVLGARFGFGAKSTAGLYELWQIDNLAIQLDADLNPQVTITRDPQDVGICPGGTASFDVGVNYPTLASYQWQRRAPGVSNFVAISDGTNAAYVTPPLTIADVGTAYRVLASGLANTATSAVAQVVFIVPQPSAPAVSLDFNSGLPTNAALFGSAYVSGGTLELNSNATFQTGSFILNDPMPGQVISNFTARFNLRLTGITTPPADGFSFNWATDLPNATFGEDGAGSGLTISFDTFDNGGGEAPAVDILWGGTVVAHRLVPLSLLVTGTNFVEVFIRVNADATLDLVYGCQSVYARQPVPGLTALMGARFGIGGRTGGAVETHGIDDFTLEFGSSTVSLPLVIGNVSRTGNGSFQMGFTNSPGVSFSVWATTNLALPIPNWILLGAPTEVTPGSYRFIDSQATNAPYKFYKVFSP